MRKQIKQHSSLILSFCAGLGVISTACLAARAGFQSAQILSSQDPHETNKQKALRVWKLYIPTAGSAAITIVCLAGVKRIDARKTLAAQGALALSQRAYEGYRAQVIEQLGEKKDQLFLSKVAEERVKDNPPPAIIAGSGEFLCCEAYTGRYFKCDMQTLVKSINEINSQLVKHDTATLDDFYYLIHLGTTTVSGEVGWRSSRLVELEFSSILHDDRPVLVFDYNYVTTL